MSRRRKVSSDHLAQPAGRSRNLIGTRPRPIRKEPVMPVKVTPQEAADALGISLWDLAIAQSKWASDELSRVVLDVTSNRAATLADLEDAVGKARRHWEGALETMKAIDAA